MTTAPPILSFQKRHYSEDTLCLVLNITPLKAFQSYLQVQRTSCDYFLPTHWKSSSKTFWYPNREVFRLFQLDNTPQFAQATLP